MAPEHTAPCLQGKTQEMAGWTQGIRLPGVCWFELRGQDCWLWPCTCKQPVTQSGPGFSGVPILLNMWCVCLLLTFALQIVTGLWASQEQALAALAEAVRLLAELEADMHAQLTKKAGTLHVIANVQEAFKLSGVAAGLAKIFKVSMKARIQLQMEMLTREPCRLNKCTSTAYVDTPSAPLTPPLPPPALHVDGVHLCWLCVCAARRRRSVLMRQRRRPASTPTTGCRWVVCIIITGSVQCSWGKRTQNAQQLHLECIILGLLRVTIDGAVMQQSDTPQHTCLLQGTIKAALQAWKDAAMAEHKERLQRRQQGQVRQRVVWRVACGAVGRRGCRLWQNSPNCVHSLMQSCLCCCCLAGRQQEAQSRGGCQVSMLSVRCTA